MQEEKGHLLDLNSATVHLSLVHLLDGIVCLLLCREGDETETLTKVTVRRALEEEERQERTRDRPVSRSRRTTVCILDELMQSSTCKETYVNDLTKTGEVLLESLLIAAPF